MKNSSTFVLAAAAFGAFGSMPAWSADDNPYRSPSAEIRSNSGASVAPADPRSERMPMGSGRISNYGSTGNTGSASVQGSAAVSAPVGTVTTSNGVTTTVVPGDYRPSTSGAVESQNRGDILLDGRR